MKKLLMTVALAATTITACSPQGEVAAKPPQVTVTESVLLAQQPPIVGRIEKIELDKKKKEEAKKKAAAAKSAEAKAKAAAVKQEKKKAAKAKKTSSVETNLINHMKGQGVSAANAQKFASIIKDKSDKYGVDPYTILAMVQVESRYNPNALGSHSDTGLMQILPATQRYMKVRGNLFDPSVNIEVGAKYLSYCQKRFGDNLGIVAYNQGEGNVSRGTYKTWYLDKVLKAKSTISR